VVGILNVTPDSFSDGGVVNSIDKAIIKVESMLEEGVDVIDIGGESTRPGFEAISSQEEIDRVRPIIATCIKRFPEAVFSIDTSKEEVARMALDEGVLILNDIWGLRRDAQLGPMASEFNAGVFLMRNGRLEAPGSFDEGILFDRVVDYWKRSIEIGEKAGLGRDQLVLDPGIGFGTTREEDLAFFRLLPRFCDLGFGLLVGASRKRVTGLGGDLRVEERLESTLATTVAAIQGGADFVRVHDARENVRAARMADLIYRGNE